MALTKLTANVSNIQTLSDKPNQNENLTPVSLKQKFDKGVEDTKDYINNTLTNELDTKLDTLTATDTSLQTQVTSLDQKTTTINNNFISFRSQTNARLSSTLGSPSSIDGVSNATKNIDLVAGTGIRITPNNTDKTITFEATGTAVPVAHGHTHAVGGTDPITGFAEMASAITTNTTDIINHVNNKEMHVPFRVATQFTQEEYKNHYTYYYAGFGNTSVSTLADGQTLRAKCNSDSTGAVYLHVDVVNEKPVVKANGLPVTNWKANGIYTLVYNATTGNFIQQGEGGEYGTDNPNDVKVGVVFGTETGLKTGTFTADATITGSDVMKGKIAYANGQKITGTYDIPNEAWFQPHNQWYKCTAHPATNGSDAIKGTMGCVCDNKLYLFSFFLPASASNYWGWNVYDPTTNLWTKDYVYTGVSPSYSTYICGIFNHIIYLKITDGTTTSTTDKIYAYDTILKIMTSFSIKTLETHDTSSRWIMTDENTFYSIGGASSKLTYSYNKITDTITSRTNCPVYLSNPSCVYNPSNNTIYVVGNKSTVYDQPTPLYAYDCSANTWVSKADYATDPRYNLSIILKDANTLLIGGGIKTTDWWEGSFKVYDITTNTYTLKPYSPMGKQVGSLGIINDKVYFFGGYTSNGGYDNTYVYFY
ncbi:hypothetical protein [Clostridium sp. BNL1100]|uniref:hypothetical protein n=1 Tax=Clostridium sp. BNL1100 TaxID=755731 RepID=UPI00024A7A91|nr:hypothetical protein [Clostridium sp. BNL1100]AEY66601.1 hypothetical protein Clo1100_2430 [Clostridium sp. BNL1100]